MNSQCTSYEDSELADEFVLAHKQYSYKIIAEVVCMVKIDMLTYMGPYMVLYL